jgi:hypothetical protein
VEDLLSEEEDRTILPRQATITEKEEKKSGLGKVSKASQALTDKVLDAPVAMTLRELLRIRPATLKTLTGATEDNKRGIALDVKGEALNSGRIDGTSYVLVKLGDNEVSLFVGIGASCCIVTRTRLKAMGIPYKIKESWMLLPAAG